jgi:Ammonium Transporter Family
VGSLHGLPSILGAMASLVFIALNPSADFLTHAKGSQMGRQVAAIATTLAVSMISGFATGKVMALFQEDDIHGDNMFADKSYWETAYFDPSVPRRAAAVGPNNNNISPHSKHSIKGLSKHSQKYDLTASNHIGATVAPVVAAAPEHAPGTGDDVDNDPSENA